jgi:sugar lactone lactonase YvrE
MVIGRSGGVATSLAREAGGAPIRFANDLDVHRNGSVFFTDTSMRYSRKCADQTKTLWPLFRLLLKTSVQ